MNAASKQKKRKKKTDAKDKENSLEAIRELHPWPLRAVRPLNM